MRNDFLRSRCSQLIAFTHRLASRPVLYAQTRHVSELLPYLIDELRAGPPAKLVTFSKRPFEGSFALQAQDLLRRRLNFFGNQGLEAAYRRLGFRVGHSALLTFMRNYVTASSFADNFLAATPSKSDLEGLSLDGCLIGDLIYDTYLRQGHATADFSDPGLRALIIEAFITVKYWTRRINKTCRAVIGDTVYLNAIPTRVAVLKGCPTFYVGGANIFRMRSDFPPPEQSYRFYLSRTHEMGHQEKAISATQGKQFVEQRLAGAISGRLSNYMSLSPYHSEPTSPTPQRVQKAKSILVACHDFFDSPHVWGTSLFPDFYEWLVFLARFFKEKPRPIVVKPHPNSREADKKILEEIFVDTPKVSIESANSTMASVLGRFDVAAALTVCGTIATELPAIGIPVINASQNNPHFDFGFSVSPVTIEEYRSTLERLDDLKPTKDLTDLYLYHYLHNVEGPSLDLKHLLAGDLTNSEANLSALTTEDSPAKSIRGRLQSFLETNRYQA